jgi:hypothetical protein
MADKVTTSFPTMGQDALAFANTSAKASTDLRTPRKAYSMVEAATAKHRNTILERLGHKGAIQATMVYPNSPEHSATQRNLHIMPRKAGLSDFSSRAAYGDGQVQS